MPLDSGAVTSFTPGVGEGGFPAHRGEPATIGAALRAMREARGLTVQDLAEDTKIRRSYLTALEDMKLDLLPSRPFIIGYVRAYAQAIGMDPAAAVARFKLDAPIAAEPLRPPVGVSRERDPRWTLAAVAAVAVLSAVLVWNFAQHAVAKEKAPSSVIPEAAAPAPAASVHGPVVLSAALPAPRESDAPAPYVTPGLEAAAAAKAAAAAGLPTPAPALIPAASAPLAVIPVDPKAKVYGAAPDQSAVTLRARKAASLVVRGGDGAVYFARQLAVGEGYRAPLLKGLTLDVSDPAAFDIYSNGQLTGQLQAAQTPLAKLAG